MTSLKAQQLAIRARTELAYAKKRAVKSPVIGVAYKGLPAVGAGDGWVHGTIGTLVCVTKSGFVLQSLECTDRVTVPAVYKR